MTTIDPRRWAGLTWYAKATRAAAMRRAVNEARAAHRARYGPNYPEHRDALGRWIAA